MVINLRRERNRYRSVKGVAEKSAVASSTISDILNGNSWPALETMARLEAGLGVRLWPGVKATRGNT
ncbi:helix-turn-helix domain-containing protein [Corynebacterium urealyticum]|uniref:helix-turn-helix domain-containing protein n=1 Tax=Corynebacterium urealyticum TaxID=43771 RepID=UPI0039B73D22